MLQFLPVEEDNVFAIRATGKLTHADYQEFLPQLEARIKSEAPISLLIELDDFHGWTLEAVKDDFKIGTSTPFERIALLGNKSWQRWMAAMSVPFINAEVRYFDRDEVSDAWDWLRESDEDESYATIDLPPYRNIVVAVDFSTHSSAAAQRALEIADHYQANVTLLHVINEEYLYDILYGPTDVGLTGYESAQDIKANEEALTQQAKKQMADLKTHLQRPDLLDAVVVGTPANAIISVAEARRAELIVMGTHGRRGLARLLGSTARTVVMKSRCEVLSVPLPRKASQEETS